MAVADMVQVAVSQKEKRPEKFKRQLDKYQRFKDKMEKAGVEIGDKYEIPLMQRIGHTTQSK